MDQPAIKNAVLVFLCLVLAGCGGGGGSYTGSQPPPVQSAQVPRSGIKHLMIVVMQNDSFDHLFGKYPGVNGLDSSLPSYKQIDQAGNTVSPQLLTDLSPAGLNHTATSYQTAYDSGKMDKYAWANGDLSMQYYDNTSIGPATDGQQFGVDTLWSYAQQYAVYGGGKSRRRIRSLWLPSTRRLHGGTVPTKPGQWREHNSATHIPKRG